MTTPTNTAAILTAASDAERAAFKFAVTEMFAETGGDFVSYIGRAEMQAGEALVGKLGGCAVLIDDCEDTVNGKPLLQLCPTSELVELFEAYDFDCDAIEAAIDACAAPAAPVEVTAPRNALTGTEYSGKNVDILIAAQIEGGFPTSEWVTFRQALKLGRCVAKGQKASAAIFKVVDRKADEAKGTKGRKVARTYKVFNLAQTVELPAKAEAAAEVAA